MIFVVFLAVPASALIVMAVAWGCPRVQAALVVAMSGANLVTAGYGLLHAQPAAEYVLGGWSPAVGIVLRLDMLSAIPLALTACVLGAAALYHLGQTLAGARGTSNPVYHLGFPMLLLSLNGLFLTHDLFNFYVFYELLAVSSYVLVAVGNDFPHEAAWKYAIQSILGSTALLIGVASLYASAGTLNMTAASANLTGPLAHVAPFFLCAFLLKGSLFPFHFWQQDAYAAASSPGSAILAGALANVGAYGLMRLWPLLFGPTFREGFVWLGAASVVFGALAAWQQANVKRLLGFSSVSQLGFVLLGIGWGTVGSSAASLLFLVHHGLSKALLFLSAGALADAHGVTHLRKLRGAGKGLPWLQVSFLVGGLSLVGMPPTLGLVGKLMLLREGFGLERWLGTALILAGSLFTLGYVTRAHRVLFWEPAEENASPATKVPLMSGFAIGWLGLMVLLGGAAGAWLWEACEAGARVSLSKQRVL